MSTCHEPYDTRTYIILYNRVCIAYMYCTGIQSYDLNQTISGEYFKTVKHFTSCILDGNLNGWLRTFPSSAFWGDFLHSNFWSMVIMVQVYLDLLLKDLEDDIALQTWGWFNPSFWWCWFHDRRMRSLSGAPVWQSRGDHRGGCVSVRECNEIHKRRCIF